MLKCLAKMNDRAHTPCVTYGASPRFVFCALAFCALALCAVGARAQEQPSLTLSVASPQTLYTNSPSRTEAQRVTLFIRETRDIQFAETILSAIVVDPVPLTAEVAGGGHVVRLTGLDFGETLLILLTPRGRRTLYVEVVGHSISESIAKAEASERQRERQARQASGSYTLVYVPAYGESGAYLGFRYDFRRKLAHGRTLEISGDLFRGFGGGEVSAFSPAEVRTGFDRLSVAISGDGYTMNFLDSEIDVSQLSLSGYAMRGVRLSATETSRFDGAQVFAGLARPAFTLFGGSRAFVLGGIAPVARGRAWRARAGAIMVSSLEDRATPATAAPRGGMLFHTDARYNPDDDTLIEGEADLTQQGISWRAVASIRRRKFNIAGELSTLDADSPLVAAGAQAGGRSVQSLAAGWEPSRRFNLSVALSHTTHIAFRPSVSLSQRIPQTPLGAHTALANFNYRPRKGTQLSLRFAAQTLDLLPVASSTPSAASSEEFVLSSRNFGATWDQAFGSKWNNNADIRFSASRERKSTAALDTGWSVRDELRRSWEKWSAAASFSHTASAQTLESLLLRNPSLLPFFERQIYERDPRSFIVANRGRFAELLPGVELPESASTEVGLKLQGTLSRFALMSETRFVATEVAGGSTQRGLQNAVNATARLDDANSIGVTATQAFTLGGAGRTHAGVSISYTHAFGATAQGFGFGKLLSRWRRGEVHGRVYLDRNGNGRDDEGEPGVPGLQVRLDDRRTARTDAQGRFRLDKVDNGTHRVALVGEGLGTRWRASSQTEREVEMNGRRGVEVSFGITDFGFFGGRIFNDTRPPKAKSREADLAANQLNPTSNPAAIPETMSEPGIAGVRVRLRGVSSETDAAKEAASSVTDGSGGYEFHNIAPGNYTLEVDPETLPANFDPPAELSRQVTVRALESVYRDLPFVAQRAVAGTVFIDRDGDNKFDRDADEAVAGARIRLRLAGSEETIEATTNANGAYIFRRLPAGHLEIKARLQSGAESRAVELELGAEPVTRRGMNLSLARP